MDDRRYVSVSAEVFAKVGGRREHSPTARLSRRICALQHGSDEGQSLVEFALTLPVMLLVVTGLCAFAIAMNSYLQLTDAVNVAARQLAISRGLYLDPCAQATSAFYAAAPLLTKSSLNFKYTLNGTAYSGTSCNSSSYTSGAAGNLSQGSTATMQVTYTFNLKVYGATYISNGLMTAQTSEMVQ